MEYLKHSKQCEMLSRSTNDISRIPLTVSSNATTVRNANSESRYTMTHAADAQNCNNEFPFNDITSCMATRGYYIDMLFTDEATGIAFYNISDVNGFLGPVDAHSWMDENHMSRLRYFRDLRDKMESEHRAVVPTAWLAGESREEFDRVYQQYLRVKERRRLREEAENDLFAGISDRICEPIASQIEPTAPIYGGSSSTPFRQRSAYNNTTFARHDMRDTGRAFQETEYREMMFTQPHDNRRGDMTVGPYIPRCEDRGHLNMRGGITSVAGYHGMGPRPSNTTAYGGVMQNSGVTAVPSVCIIQQDFDRRLPNFTGKENPVKFMMDFEIVAKTAEWSDQQKCTRFRFLLKREPEHWIRQLPDYVQEDWPELKRRFMKAYNGKEVREDHVVRLMTIKQGKRESIDHFINRIEDSVGLAYPNAGVEIRESLLLTHTRSGLRHELRKRLLITAPTCWEEARRRLKVIAQELDFRSSDSSQDSDDDDEKERNNKRSRKEPKRKKKDRKRDNKCNERDRNDKFRDDSGDESERETRRDRREYRDRDNRRDRREDNGRDNRDRRRFNDRSASRDNDYRNDRGDSVGRTYYRERSFSRGRDDRRDRSDSRDSQLPRERNYGRDDHRPREYNNDRWQRDNGYDRGQQNNRDYSRNYSNSRPSFRNDSRYRGIIKDNAPPRRDARPYREPSTSGSEGIPKTVRFQGSSSRCYNCGETGHMARNCTRPAPMNESSIPAKPPRMSNVNSEWQDRREYSDTHRRTRERDESSTERSSRTSDADNVRGSRRSSPRRDSAARRWHAEYGAYSGQDAQVAHGQGEQKHQTATEVNEPVATSSHSHTAAQNEANEQSAFTIPFSPNSVSIEQRYPEIPRPRPKPRRKAFENAIRSLNVPTPCVAYGAQRSCFRVTPEFILTHPSLKKKLSQRTRDSEYWERKRADLRNGNFENMDERNDDMEIDAEADRNCENLITAENRPQEIAQVTEEQQSSEEVARETVDESTTEACDATKDKELGEILCETEEQEFEECEKLDTQNELITVVQATETKVCHPMEFATAVQPIEVIECERNDTVAEVDMTESERTGRNEEETMDRKVGVEEGDMTDSLPCAEIEEMRINEKTDAESIAEKHDSDADDEIDETTTDAYDTEDELATKIAILQKKRNNQSESNVRRKSGRTRI